MVSVNLRDMEALAFIKLEIPMMYNILQVSLSGANRHSTPLDTVSQLQVCMIMPSNILIHALSFNRICLLVMTGTLLTHICY